jgi:hypothetical protein
MGPLISFLVFMVLLFAGLAQTSSVPPKLGYGIAGTLAVVTFALAIVRFKARKDRGE